jgi:sugar transferase (PEP-CTERM/EpsH1 system associated)
MQKILYLAQRVPYPPDKGDKIASFHILKYLSERAEVYLGTFADDPADMAYIPNLKEYCKDVLVLPLDPNVAKLKSLGKLLTNEALTLGYFYDSRLAKWVDKTLVDQNISKSLIFCSAMAQYVSGDTYSSLKRFAHFVDIDSDKWAQYAAMGNPVKKWVYGREARLLERFEKEIAHEFDATGFVAPFEANQFKALVPDIANKIKVIQNGTDTEYFSPNAELENPYSGEELSIVFTGAMDYFPNEDAVKWFAKDIFPAVLQRFPNSVFYIVGSKPGPEVLALQSLSNVKVTGRVPDVRPYLKYAALSVAPLRAARGIQNKVLEAMAMGLQVVGTAEVKRGLAEACAAHVALAFDAATFTHEVCDFLAAPNKNSSPQLRRDSVIREYSWDANLAPISSILSL